MGKTLDLKPVDGSFSLKEHIYDVLKTSIMDLDIYEPDTNLRMDERTLADRLGISRTPIREAIMRLEQEGLAARLACEHATDSEVGRLRQIGTQFTKDKVKAHLSEYSEANIDFHLCVLGMSKCQMLQDIAQGLFTHLLGNTANGFAYTGHQLVGELGFGVTTDIVGAEDMFRQVRARRVGIQITATGEVQVQCLFIVIQHTAGLEHRVGQLRAMFLERFLHFCNGYA